MNFPALTARWGRGLFAITVSWALPVPGITLTVAAAQLLGEQLAVGAAPIDLRAKLRVEFWAAVAVTVVNYLLFSAFSLAMAQYRGRQKR